jgi:hypothetical protein
MALPIVQGSEVQTPTSGVKVDVGPFREAAMASGKMLAGIGSEATSLFSDVAQKLQENKRSDAVFKADIAMTKNMDNFRADLKKNPNTATWEDDHQKMVQQTKNQIFSDPSLDNATRKILDQQVEKWSISTGSEVKMASLLKQASDTKLNALTVAQSKANKGDLEGANAAIQLAVDSYAMTKEEGASQFEDIKQTAYRNQTDARINQQPIESVDWLKETVKDKDGKDVKDKDGFKVYKNIPEMSPSDRLQLINKAEIAANKYRVEQTDDIVKRIQLGEVVGDKEIDGLVKSNVIKASEANYIKEQRNRLKPDPNHEINYANFLTQINEYSRQNDPKNEQYAHLSMQLLAYSGIEQQFLKQQLNKMYNEKPDSTETGSSAEKYLTTLYNKGLLGNISMSRKTPGTPANEAQARQAARALIVIGSNLRQYLKKNPNATISDQIEQIDTWAASPATVNTIMPVSKNTGRAIKQDSEEVTGYDDKRD